MKEAPAVKRTVEQCGWSTPTRTHLPTFFPEASEKVLRDEGITSVEADCWYDRGWLSFSSDSIEKIDEPEWAELVFIRDLVRSGLGRYSIDGFLADLTPPYRFHPLRVAYNFALGWVERPAVPEPDPEEFTADQIEQWADAAAANGDRDALWEAVDAILSAIRSMEFSE